MPMYQYLCEANGQSIEVVHRMADRYETWGELCANSSAELGDTPPDTPVKRLIGGGSVNNQANTVSKVAKRQGEASRWSKGGIMAAPPRTSKF